MFTHGLKTLDSIPSTQHALFQHAKHVLLTVAFVWKESLYKKKTPRSQTPVNVAGNGMTEPKSGWHIG